MKNNMIMMIAILLLGTGMAYAQHDHHMHTAPADTVKKAPAHQHPATPIKQPVGGNKHKPAMPADTAKHKHGMPSSYSRNLPMNRDGSGTSWQPDESPMMMYMLMKNNTALMWHGAVYPRLTVQDVFKKSQQRGGARFGAPNWFMFMLNQYIGKHGTFNFSTMLSLDALTEGGAGYPLLFQSGESYNGQPLVDRQHPHDLFSGLSVAYTHSFTRDIDLTAYFGYPGEPALGPGAFMHRVSAMNNPDAPISHHWQDASHITFGVATLGFRYKFAKIEGSIFTGREPNAMRYDFDKPRFDSYSYRLSFNPISQLSMQFSQGFIHSPEELEPELNIMRTTASVLHTKKFKGKSFIASALVWGYNRDSEKTNLHSLLAESNLRLKPLNIYTRYEWVQKNPHELQLAAFDHHQVFNVHALTLGLNVPIVDRLNTELSLGTQMTLNFPDEKLKSIYGNYPLGAQVYLRLAPAINLN
ncbi:MAG TPA: hypothetical protein VK174_13530 [Chitinophagales bacterium]|nr:hypothetical protein [Chitinophagales bacterium]